MTPSPVSRVRSLRGAVFAASLLAGCADGGPPAQVPDGVALDTRRTTNPDVAVGNLDAAIEALRARLTGQPGDLDLVSALVDRLLSRTAFLGSYDDFQEVEQLTRDAYAQHPGVARAILQRASFLSAVHRFGEATALLDEAALSGGEAGEIERARIVIELAQGVDPSSLLPRAQALVDEWASFARLNVLASVYGALGQYQEADDTYMRALAAYRDVSPFALAFTSFTRGVMWGEAADRPDLALVLYRDAVARLPQYVVANVHLSELEDAEAAVARLERIAADAGDPEPSGKLAERLAEVDPARAADLRDAATGRYDALLARHEEAFLDHGAEFFAGPGGDPRRALGMALENLALRPVPRAYVVAVEAALATGDEATACELLDASTPLQGRHRVLAALAAENARRCR